jgi:hypothetical protein
VGGPEPALPGGGRVCIRPAGKKGYTWIGVSPILCSEAVSCRGSVPDPPRGSESAGAPTQSSTPAPSVRRTRIELAGSRAGAPPRFRRHPSRAPLHAHGLRRRRRARAQEPSSSSMRRRPQRRWCSKKSTGPFGGTGTTTRRRRATKDARRHRRGRVRRRAHRESVRRARAPRAHRGALAARGRRRARSPREPAAAQSMSHLD